MITAKQLIGLGGLLVILTAGTQPTDQPLQDNAPPNFAIAVHGGAGTVPRERITPEREAAYRATLSSALSAGHEILASGGTSMDAVVASIRILEDFPLFNAGHGSALTHDGKNELDASIMDGATLDAGAVTGVTIARSPIVLARAVMEQSPHVMLAGAGADAFAKEIGLELVDPGYFYTERAHRQLQEALESEDQGSSIEHNPDHKFGTVGVVALDSFGNLAAGTSTGGMNNKRWGRVGDSPIIGAGTYANNNSCAVSATGHGEYFIRATVARSISALMEYGGLSLQDAASRVVHGDLVKLGGDGGIIAVDKDGNIVLAFNEAANGMFRGSWREGEEPYIGIFDDD